MSKIKIGRNDKCPCGSSKKYKNCCMIKEQTRIFVKSEVNKYSQAEKDLTTLIIKYLRSKDNESNFELAIEKYFGGELSEINITDSEFNFFMSWYVKNYEFNSPFIDRLYKKEEKNISDEMKELLENLKSSNLYLYKIKNTENGKITLQNMNDNSEIELYDEMLEQNININDIIYARIYKTGKLYKMFGGAMFIPYFITDEILTDIKEAWENCDKNISYDDFLQLYSIEIIKKLITDRPDDRIIYNEDNQVIQYSVTKYKILDRAKCNFILENIDGLIKNESEINIIYQWKKYKDNVEMIIGEVTISEEELKVETDSFERKDLLQELLEHNLKGIIKFEDEDYFTIRQLQEETDNVSEQTKTSDEVERLLLDNMKLKYTSTQIRDAIVLAKKHKARLNRLKAESIAAAIEYIIVSQENLPQTQKDIADKYNISSSTIGKWAKNIKDNNI